MNDASHATELTEVGMHRTNPISKRVPCFLRDLPALHAPKAQPKCPVSKQRTRKGANSPTHSIVEEEEIQDKRVGCLQSFRIIRRAQQVTHKEGGGSELTSKFEKTGKSRFACRKFGAVTAVFFASDCGRDEQK